MNASADDFKAAMRNFASGVTIVTSVDQDGQSVGATVSAFSSVSAEPPTVLVCLNASSRSAEAVHASGVLSIHILSRNHVDLAMRFATDKSNKFPQDGLQYGATGAPALPECDIRLDCEVEAETAGGSSHRVFICRVANIAVTDIDPLIYANRTFCDPRPLPELAAA